MVSSFLIGLREGLEAALIIGITLGVLRKMGRRDLSGFVWLGVGIAILISLSAAFIFQLIGASLEGTAEEIFEGIMMLLAAIVLTWMIFWMQRMGRQVKSDIETDVRSAVSRGYRWGLFGIAFFAVLREGIETALFLTAIALTSSVGDSFIGGILGILAAGLLGGLLFASTVRLNLRRFFQISSLLLILFAAGLFSHAIHEFAEAGWLPAIVDPIWDTNSFLDENSPAGQLLKALFGYNGNPTLIEVIAYLGYYIFLFITFRAITLKIPSLVKSDD